MIMDLGRSSFRKWFQFFAPIPRTPAPIPRMGAIGLGTPRPRTRVRWYVAPVGAKVFPVPHIWGSSAFYDDYEKATQTIGEDPYEQEYDLGNTPIGATGQKFCGKLTDFTDPIPWPNTIGTPKRGPSGLLKCCGLAGAVVFTTPSREGACECCGGNTPDNIRIKISAPGYDFDGVEMVIPRMDSSPCEWTGSTFIAPDRLLQFSCGLLVGSPCIMVAGFGYSDGSITIEFNRGQAVAAPPFTCSPFFFTATMSILDILGNPTGDFATMTKI